MVSQSNNMEKQFLDNLDRLLAGEEITLSPALTDDCRTALDFARAMLRLRPEPTPDFKERLKTKLLRRLEEMETASSSPRRSFREWWLGLWRENPAWRTAAVMLVVALVAVGTMGRLGVFDRVGPSLGLGGEPGEKPAPVTVEIPPTSPPPSSVSPQEVHPTPPVRPADVMVMAVTGQNAYLPGEVVTVEFSLRNTTDEPQTVEPFPPAVTIIRPGRPQDETVRTFPAGDGIKQLAAEEEVTYNLTWEQRDDAGQAAAYGYYRFRLDAIPPQVIGGFYILPPEGVIEGLWEPQATRFVSGVTATMERVDMALDGLDFQLVMTPPGYDADTPIDPDSLPEMPPLPEAGYRLDDGELQALGQPSIIAPQPDGFLYIWRVPAPVPASVRELSLTISDYGGWEGPWEFRIPLE